MDFIAAGLVEFVGGVSATIVVAFFSPFAALLLAGTWLATHWLLRESAVWKDRNTETVREAQRHADYGYRIAVDPPAAKELRLFGLSEWIVERFAARRRQLHDLRWEATRLREKSVVWSLLLITVANLVVFAFLAQAALAGEIVLGQMVTYASAAVSTSMIAFGGLSWALDGAAAPVAAVLRLQTTMGVKGALATGVKQADGLPAQSIRFRDVSFQYPNATTPVLQSFDLTIPAGSSLAIVGQNGAGKTTLPKLICRLYDPSSGSIEIDGYDLVVKGLLAGLDTQLGPTWPAGVNLGIGQWQKLALARGFMRARPLMLVLDEPTAALDAQTEHALFERSAASARAGAGEGRVTILVSHRFSTVRMADLIVVMDGARVAKVGDHDDLMARHGQYAELYNLQANAYR